MALYLHLVQNGLGTLKEAEAEITFALAAHALDFRVSHSKERKMGLPSQSRILQDCFRRQCPSYSWMKMMRIVHERRQVPRTDHSNCLLVEDAPLKFHE